MDNVAIKEFVKDIPDLARIKLIELIQKEKVSTNFLNRLIEMYSNDSKSWVKYIIKDILSDLEEGLAEEKILWLYSYKNDINHYYFELIEKREDFYSEKSAKETLPHYHKVMKEAFNTGATIEQVEVIAMHEMPINQMESYLTFLKLGIGLKVDYSQMHYGNTITELNKEATEKLEQILLNL